MRALALAITLLLVTAHSSSAQGLWPGVTYDPAIPTLPSVLGWDSGEEITPPDGIVTYLRALQAAAPDRSRLIEYARTWEGRPLHVLVIGSSARISQLDQVTAGLRRLADPRGASSADLDRLVADLPVVTWLMHAVHGNEISSSDAALAEAYHLLAARGNADVDLVLRESLVVIDPLQNPDGRARFVHTNQQGRALTQPDDEPASAEHDEPWPGGRANHYLFDMNRDWFALSQPETRGRVSLMLDYYPHVLVDLHEQSGNSTYYFAPPADPINPYITENQRKWLTAFGQANGDVFDGRGFPYFIREVFDSFYPGYGESWPIFHGAIGMTYEMASSRGLRFRRADGDILTYRDGVVRHFTSAVTTAVTAARNRQAILREFLEYRQSAVQLAETGTRAYLVDAGGDPSRAIHLGRRLAAQGVEVSRADEPVTVGDRTLPAGSLIVPLAQPAGRLVRNLLDPDISQGEAFIAEQDRRRQRGLGDQIYDVTAWNIALLYDLDVVSSAAPVTARSTPIARTDDRPDTGPALPAARVGYLMPWGLGAAEAAVELLQGGVRLHALPRAVTVAGRAYPAGTVFMRVQENPADLAARLGRLAARHTIQITPIDTAFVDRGVSLGSNEVGALRAPRVLMAWDAPTSSLSAGWTRYTLEQRFGQPVTAVRTGSLGRIDLSRYDVLVLPSGNYGFNEDLVRRIREWAGRGGTIVTLGEASRWATTERAGLLPTHLLQRDGSASGVPAEPKPPAKVDLEKFDYETAIRPESGSPDSTAGTILRVRLDGEHWMSAGLDAEIQVVMEGSRVFMPLTLDKGTNVGVYEGSDRLIAAGLMWPETRNVVQQKAYLMHVRIGQGHLVAFAEDPNFRAYTEATMLLFMNAVLLGSGY
ncbi:MAG TPA: M14 metallopeptidase family protein [Vicinamibacterales bacterium]|nr:M14 metallopeptidase family protein [Vicinamibacterales bacterium]